MLQQILYFIGGFFALPFLPIMAILGKRVRKNVPSLPEASENIIGKIEGKNGEIHFVTLGESTIAGVGVNDHKDGITGQIARTINEATQKTLHWQVLARNGYTAALVNKKLVPQIPEKPLDFIVIGLGGNDTFHLNSPLTFRKNMILCLQNIQKRQPNAKIYITNMPPVGNFPAFPWLIKLILGNLVKLHGAVINDLPKQFENVYYIGKNIEFIEQIRNISKENMLDYFSDGIHPSPMTYGLWGKEIGGYILKNT